MVRIIINADDCGLNPKVNAAIDHALTVNAISSTTILANSKYLDEVHRMVEQHPKASFGIHLNITEGESLTKSEIFFKYGVTDADGQFVKGNSKRCSNPSEELKKAIKEEWDTQLDLLINQEQFSISHVDGHHHCHTWPGLDSILVELMKKYGITKTRNRYYTPCVTLSQKVKSFVLHLFVPISNFVPILRRYSKQIILFNKYNRCLKDNAIITTDFFGSYDELSKFIVAVRLKDKVVELMCHPGNPTYLKEEQAVLQDVIGIKTGKYKLVSYLLL
jgi:predicted glycoside hydrolase/deacetylase ChbG (UPF0249 family)